MKRLLLILGLFISFQCFSQVMVESTGEYYYERGNRVSKEEAMEYALTDARTKAVEKAYGNDVTVFESLSINNKRENYHLVASSQTNGLVRVIESDFSYTKKSVKVNIVAIVDKNNKDSFIKVDGIKTTYQLTEPIRFKVTFYDSGYLYVFGLSTSKKGVQLYPNWDESRSNYYEKQSVKTFPTTSILYVPVRREKGVAPKNLDRMPKDYSKLFLCESGDFNHTMTLFFILTKTPRPFKKDVTYNNILEWYFKIPEEDKNGIEVKNFTVID